MRGGGQHGGPAAAVGPADRCLDGVSPQHRRQVGEQRRPLRLVATLGLPELPGEQFAVGFRVGLRHLPQLAQVTALGDQVVRAADRGKGCGPRREELPDRAG
jgi:hypothetical protein